MSQSTTQSEPSHNITGRKTLNDQLDEHATEKNTEKTFCLSPDQGHGSTVENETQIEMINKTSVSRQRLSTDLDADIGTKKIKIVDKRPINSSRRPFIVKSVVRYDRNVQLACSENCDKLGDNTNKARKQLGRVSMPVQRYNLSVVKCIECKRSFEGNHPNNLIGENVICSVECMNKHKLSSI